jgi:hypothetical protein
MSANASILVVSDPPPRERPTTLPAQIVTEAGTILAIIERASRDPKKWIG